jgi:hypothetical protein
VSKLESLKSQEAVENHLKIKFPRVFVAALSKVGRFNERTDFCLENPDCYEFYVYEEFNPMI